MDSNNVRHIDPAKDRLDRLIQYLSHDPTNDNLFEDACQKAMDIGDNDRVLSILALCKDLTYTSASSYAHRGTLFLHTNNLTDAIEDFNNALTLGLDAPAIRYNLAYCYYLDRQFDAANTTLDALPASEYSAEHGLLRARIAYNLQQDNEAIAALEALQTQAHNTPESDSLLLLLQQESETADPANILEAADTLLAASPHQLEARLARAAIHLDNNEMDAAQHDFDTAIEHHPTSGRAWLGKAQILFHHFQFDEATPALNAAIQHMPDHVGTWHLVGWNAIMLGHIDQALDAFEHALTLDDSFGETHGGLAAVFALQHHTAKAERHIRLAEKLDPHAFSTVFAKMTLLHADNKHDQANALFEQAKRSTDNTLGITPNDAIKRRIQQLTDDATP